METIGSVRDASQVIEGLRSVVEPAMRDAVDRLPPVLRTIAAYHFGWSETDEVVPAHRGKALRPAIVLLCAEAVGGAMTDAIAAAVSVELIHNFSLIHDDIMDGDATRRHRPTAWKQFGIRDAMLTGDALLALAFDILGGADRYGGDAVRTLVRTVNDLIDGQAADLHFETRSEVSLAQALTMARSKTGALFECSAALGALFGGASAPQIASLRAIGADVGLAFQLTDDLLGIWGKALTTGRPMYSDLSNRKKSLPVVFALNSESPAAPVIAEMYRRPGQLSDEVLKEIASVIEAAGGRDWCQAYLEALIDQARCALADAFSAAATKKLRIVMGLLARLARDSVG